MNDCYSRVTNLARLCCKHLYSYCQDAPHSDRLSVTFDAQELGKALHDGRKAIQPLIDDFVKASAPITLKTGGKGVRFCDTPAKCAHGCAFEIAERLLLAIENKTDKKFMQQDGDGSIRVLWGAISHEAADIVNRNAATCDDEAEGTSAGSEGPSPISETESGSVLLFDRHIATIANGTEKKKLTNAQYDVVLALLQTGDIGLTKDDLNRNSKRGDALGVLRRLAKGDSDWKSVISFPGKTGGGYRIS